MRSTIAPHTRNLLRHTPLFGKDTAQKTDFLLAVRTVSACRRSFCAQRHARTVPAFVKLLNLPHETNPAYLRRFSFSIIF